MGCDGEEVEVSEKVDNSSTSFLCPFLSFLPSKQIITKSEGEGMKEMEKKEDGRWRGRG